MALYVWHYPIKVNSTTELEKKDLIFPSLQNTRKRRPRSLQYKACFYIIVGNLFSSVVLEL